MTTFEQQLATQILQRTAELLQAEATHPTTNPTTDLAVAPGSGARDAQKTTTKRLSTASELADALGVSRRYVYAHAAELGAIRMGTGEKPRLRFDPDDAVRRLQALSAPAPAQVVASPANPRRAPSRRPTLSELLAAEKGGRRRGA